MKPKQPDRAAGIFKALGHPARVQMVRRLIAGECCVCELVEETNMGWSTVSRHLSVLRSAGVVADNKRGLQIFYRLALPCVATFLKCLDPATPSRRARKGSS
jgi:DNA-binding transcriptional ArsR family regulator